MRILTWSIGSKITQYSPKSPYCHSAHGAALFIKGRYGEAIESFERAIAIRGEWPETIRDYRCGREAMDLYFMAMAHWKLLEDESAVVPTTEPDVSLAFDRAEEMYKNQTTYEYRDLLERIRNMAITMKRSKAKKMSDMSDTLPSSPRPAPSDPHRQK